MGYEPQFNRWGQAGYWTYGGSSGEGSSGSVAKGVDLAEVGSTTKFHPLPSAHITHFNPIGGGVLGMPPDSYHLGWGATAVAGVGFSVGVNATWLAHGPEASWKPVITITGGWRLGFEASSRPNAGFGYFNGPEDKITSASLTGLGADITSRLLPLGVAFGLNDDLSRSWRNYSYGLPGSSSLGFGSVGATYTVSPAQVSGYFQNLGQQLETRAPLPFGWHW